MAEIDDLSVTDASNTGRFPEGQAPSTVNDGARALEGMLARAFKDTVDSNLRGTLSGSCYQITTNRSISQYDGLVIAFRATAANDVGAVDIRLNGYSLHSLLTASGAEVPASAIGAERWVWAQFHGSSSVWHLLSGLDAVPAIGTQGDLLTVTASGTLVALGVGSADTVLTSDGTSPSWSTVSTTAIADQAITTGKLTTGTAGDLLYWQTSGSASQLPAGTNGDVMVMASGLPAWSTAPTLDVTDLTVSSVSVLLTVGTSVSLSSTSTDISTSIPAGTDVIILSFDGLTLSGGEQGLVQIGSTTFTTTGYTGGSQGSGSTSGFAIRLNGSTNVFHGQMVLRRVTGNTWNAALAGNFTGGSNDSVAGGGYVALSGALDRVRVTQTGSDTLTGTVGIQYQVGV